jgi:hypothetical protein
VAMMDQPIQKCGSHFGVDKNTTPFRKCEVGRNDCQLFMKKPAIHMAKYFRLYNENRKHQTFMATPDQVYYASIRLQKAD